MVVYWVWHHTSWNIARTVQLSFYHFCIAFGEHHFLSYSAENVHSRNELELQTPTPRKYRKTYSNKNWIGPSIDFTIAWKHAHMKTYINLKANDKSKHNTTISLLPKFRFQCNRESVWVSSFVLCSLSRVSIFRLVLFLDTFKYHPTLLPLYCRKHS